MKLGCLFAPLAWLFGGKLASSQTKPTTERSPMSEGDMHSGPSGYEGGSYAGGYAEGHFHEES